MASRPDVARRAFATCFALQAGAAPFAYAGDGWWTAEAVSAQVPAFVAMCDDLPDRLAADQAAQRHAVALLEGLETSIDLLGRDAPEAARAYASRLRRDLSRHAGILEAFTTELVEDTQSAMTSAIAQATAGRGWTPCDVRPLPGFRRPSGAALAQACPGTDQSPAVAAALTNDAKLTARLASLTARPWPTLRLAPPETPVTAVGPAGAAWLAMPEYVLLLVSSELEVLDGVDREARLDLEAKAEQEGTSAREALRSLDAALDARLATARERLGAPVVQALRDVAARSTTPFALCPVPLGLGGCVGPALDDVQLVAVATDKKVLRGVKRAKRLDPESLWR
jgi:hypothetical protein